MCFKGQGDDGSVEIGYGIVEEYQGQGYATEAVESAVAWALKQSGVYRVEAETGPENTKSQRDNNYFCHNFQDIYKIS